MTARTRETYRGTSLIARTYANGVQGRVWCQGQEIAAVEGTSEEEVVTALRQLVDDTIVVETEPGSVPYPTQSAYEAALKALLTKVTAKQQLMLRAHNKARDQTLDGQELADAAGFPSWTSAKQQYGNLARALSEAMMFQPREGVRGVPSWILVLAEPLSEDIRDAGCRWRMRDEAAQATALILGKK